MKSIIDAGVKAGFLIGFILCVLLSCLCEGGREDHWLMLAVANGVALIIYEKD